MAKKAAEAGVLVRVPVGVRARVRVRIGLRVRVRGWALTSLLTKASPSSPRLLRRREPCRRRVASP